MEANAAEGGLVQTTSGTSVVEQTVEQCRDDQGITEDGRDANVILSRSASDAARN
jgi:hypothetical protein